VVEQMLTTEQIVVEDADVAWLALSDLKASKATCRLPDRAEERTRRLRRDRDSRRPPEGRAWLCNAVAVRR